MSLSVCQEGEDCQAVELMNRFRHYFVENNQLSFKGSDTIDKIRLRREVDGLHAAQSITMPAQAFGITR